MPKYDETIIWGFGGSPSPPPAVAPPPTPEDPAIKLAAKERRIALKQRKGRTATLLTGGEGVEDEGNVRRPKARQLGGTGTIV